MTEMTAGSNQYHLTFHSSDGKSSNLITEQEEKSVPGTLRLVDSECFIHYSTVYTPVLQRDVSYVKIALNTYK